MSTPITSRLGCWRLTRHARERLAERGIAPSELVDALLHPLTRDTLTKEFVWWSNHLGVVWAPATDHTGAPVKIIITVLLRGSSGERWEDAVQALAQGRTAACTVEELLREAEEYQRRSRAPRSRSRNGAVTVTNVFDGIPDSMMATARRLLIKAGHNPNDLRRVRRTGTLSLEVVVD